jgi:hypothetical protein
MVIKLCRSCGRWQPFDVMPPDPLEGWGRCGAARRVDWFNEHPSHLMALDVTCAGPSEASLLTREGFGCIEWRPRT